MVDMNLVISRGVKKAMLPRVSGYSCEQYRQMVVALRTRKPALERAFKYILSQLPSEKPITFLVPGRSGRVLFRIFWEYLRELEQERGQIIKRGKPVAVTLPIRPRHVYLKDGDKCISQSPEDAARVIGYSIANNPFYSQIFNSARLGGRVLVYLDPYEYSGKTRDTYTAVAKMFGVPEENMRHIVLTQHPDVEMRKLGALLDSISHGASWLDIKREVIEHGGKTFFVHRYVRPEGSLAYRCVWW